MSKRNSKPYQEYFLVAKGDQYFQKTGNYVGVGKTVNLADGQLGIICAETGIAHLDYGDFFSATNNPAGSGVNTSAHVPTIRILQGTPAVGDNSGASGWPNQDKGWVESCKINAGEVVSTSGRLYQIPEHSAKALVAMGEPEDDTSYMITVAMRSERLSRSYRNDKFRSAEINTGTMTATVKKDWMLQTLLRKLNMQSKLVKGNDLFIGLALNLGGANGGTPIGAVALGDQIPVMVYEGVTYYLEATAAVMQTLNTWIAGSSSITANTTIVPVNLATAGNKVAASGTITITDFADLAGDTVTVNGTALVAGVDFTAATSNNVTATNLAAEIDAISGVNAVAVGAVITVTATTAGAAGNAIAMLYVDGGTAGLTLSGATLTGGDETNVDAVAIVGLAHSLAAGYDGIAATMVDVTKSEFSLGFQNDLSFAEEVLSGTKEPLGSGRFMLLKYEDRAFAQTGLTQLNGPADQLIKAPIYIDGSTNYTAVIIDGIADDKGIAQNYRVFILVPGQDDRATTDAVTGITVSTAAASTAADINALLSPWLASIDGIKFLGAATAAAVCP